MLYLVGSRQHSLSLEHVFHSLQHNSSSSVAVPSALV